MKKRELTVEIIFALVCTLLMFAVFAGQYCFSDIVTFGKGGDQHPLCYPMFRKLCQIFTNEQAIIGVDNSSFNGASEFFLRPNLPVAYVPLYLFAWLSIFFPARTMYVVFYAVHMILALVFAQKLAKKYFNIGRFQALVYGAFIAYILGVETWYTSFYIIVALMPVVLFFLLESVYSGKIHNRLICVLVIILALTSGYVTLSLAMVVVGVSFALVYINVREKKFDFLKSFLLLICPAIAGAICLPYYMQILSYVKKVVQSSMTFADAIFYKVSLSDTLNILSNYSIFTDSQSEQLWTLSFGYIACTVLVLGIKSKVFEKMSSMERWTCYWGFGSYILILFWANETALPFSAWFYTFIPILGGMHIPLRYLMVLLPITYMGIMLVYKYLDVEESRKIFRYISCGAILVLVAYLIAGKAGAVILFINKDAFIFEMLIYAWFAYEAWRVGINHVKTLLIWSMAIIVPVVSFFYQTTDVYSRETDIQSRSIVYDDDAIKNIDDFVATLDVKERYRFAAFDSVESVPHYLVANFDWFSISKYRLCNYMGYEPHLGTPKDYMEKNPVYNDLDWKYIVDTRADFIMCDLQVLEEEEMLSTVVDFSKGIEFVGNNRYICALNKFIPSIICGEQFVLDGDSSFDNGYFYSLDLTNENVLEFETDESSYYSMTIDSDEDSVLLFLPYANRYYHYYLDGEEVASEIYDMQAIFRIPSGRHVVRVQYQNTLGQVGVTAIFASCIILPIILILNGGVAVVLKKKNEKEKKV